MDRWAEIRTHARDCLAGVSMSACDFVLGERRGRTAEERAVERTPCNDCLITSLAEMSGR